MEQLEGVPPMEQLYGPPPSYEAEPDLYMGRTSLRDPYPASHYGTPRARAAAPPLATPPRAATPPQAAAPLAASPAAVSQEMAPPRAEEPDVDLGPAAGPVVAETSDVLTAEWLLHGRRAPAGAAGGARCTGPPAGW